VKHGILILAVLVVGSANEARGQQRPLVTEDPETVGGGRVLIEGGVDLQRDVFFPVSGLRGHRVVFPSVSISVGLSSIAELQIDGAFYQRLNVSERREAPLAGLLDFDGDETTDVDDFIVATKLRLLTESGQRPAIGLRLATKLPNVSNESGLGTDMTDFYASLLFAKTIQSIRVVANGGIAILGDPTSAVPEQNDLLTFGVSVARAMTTAAELVGEINGRINASDHPDPGAENRAVMRLGGRYTRGSIRVDAAALIGMTSRDPSVGLTTGFTWVIDAFRVP
jgi:hypothetical protein